MASYSEEHNGSWGPQPAYSPTASGEPISYVQQVSRSMDLPQVRLMRKFLAPAICSQPLFSLASILPIYLRLSACQIATLEAPSV